MTLTQKERGVNRLWIALLRAVLCTRSDRRLRVVKTRERVKGRKGKGNWLGLPMQVITSDAYNQLGAWSVKLLVDVAKQYNGFNNGDLNAVWSIFKEQGWHSKGTLSRAIKELIDKGFIELTRQGGKNRCSLYAVTWKSIDECKGKLDVRKTRVASNLWKEK